MAEPREGYWTRHHWAILQWATGLYCAAFATWERFYPRSSPPKANAPVASSTGAAITHPYSMPFWLWFGIIAFVLSFLIPKVIGFRRNKRPIFDAEVFRIIRAPKGAFVKQTQDFYKAVRGAGFRIDVDILIELYVVNLSPVTQYIREISGFIEVDGAKIPLIMQRGFDAFELNDERCEWCLDPTPKNASTSYFNRNANLEALTPLADTYPVALEPKKPLEGWVRLLIPNVDLEKLNEVADYNLAIKDSTGVEHPLTKVTRREDRGEISTRNTRLR